MLTASAVWSHYMSILLETLPLHQQSFFSTLTMIRCWSMLAASAVCTLRFCYNETISGFAAVHTRFARCERPVYRHHPFGAIWTSSYRSTPPYRPKWMEIPKGIKKPHVVWTESRRKKPKDEDWNKPKDGNWDKTKTGNETRAVA